jgi:hypothetical protein
MAKFEAKGDDLFIDGKKVLKAWESYTGWYWFGVERVRTQDSIIRFDPEVVIKDDQIWFGFVQGLEEEWGEFSQGEIESLGRSKVWPIPQKNLPHAGRR